MSASVENVVALTTTPISDAAPTGASVRMDTDFETLRAAIEKMYNEGAAGVDWKKVVALSSDILSKKSKDILVASYLCCGLFYQDGHQGLSEGLDGLHRMLETFWENLHPDRTKARVASITWLSERVGAAVAQKPPKPAERDALQASIEKVNAIDSLLGDKLGGDAPSLREFSSALEQALSGLPEPAGQAAAAPAGGTETQAAAAYAPAAPAVDLSTPAGIDNAISRAFSDLWDAARALRRSRPADPLAYKVPRMVLFRQVEAIPPADGGATMVPPPGDLAGALQRMESMAASSQWAELLEEAESQFEQMALWFDPHRFASLALGGLGGDADAARAALHEEVAAFVRRFPGMVDLRFSDGSPFAADATRAWLSQEVLAGGGVVLAGPAAALAGEDQDEPFVETLEKARELARKGKIADAVTILWASSDRAPSRRQRFVRRAALARLLSESKEPRLAAAVFAALDEDVKRFGLEEWEPSLALDVVRLHLVCQRATMGDGYEVSPDAARKVEELFGRLARLDAGVALKMQR